LHFVVTATTMIYSTAKTKIEKFCYLENIKKMALLPGANKPVSRRSTSALPPQDIDGPPQRILPSQIQRGRPVDPARPATRGVAQQQQQQQKPTKQIPDIQRPTHFEPHHRVNERRKNYGQDLVHNNPGLGAYQFHDTTTRKPKIPTVHDKENTRRERPQMNENEEARRRRHRRRRHRDRDLVMDTTVTTNKGPGYRAQPEAITLTDRVLMHASFKHAKNNRTYSKVPPTIPKISDRKVDPPRDPQELCIRPKTNFPPPTQHQRQRQLQLQLKGQALTRPHNNRAVLAHDSFAVAKQGSNQKKFDVWQPLHPLRNAPTKPAQNLEFQPIVLNYSIRFDNIQFK
jgi:hypothetical protein